MQLLLGNTALNLRKSRHMDMTYASGRTEQKPRLKAYMKKQTVKQ